jgi:hypothetical protein
MVASMTGPARRNAATHAGSRTGKRSFSPPTKSDTITATSVRRSNHGVASGMSTRSQPNPSGPIARPTPR